MRTVHRCAHLLVRAEYPGIHCSRKPRFRDGQGRYWCAYHGKLLLDINPDRLMFDLKEPGNDE